MRQQRLTHDGQGGGFSHWPEPGHTAQSAGVNHDGVFTRLRLEYVSNIILDCSLVANKSQLSLEQTNVVGKFLNLIFHLSWFSSEIALGSICVPLRKVGGVTFIKLVFGDIMDTQDHDVTHRFIILHMILPKYSLYSYMMNRFIQTLPDTTFITNFICPPIFSFEHTRSIFQWTQKTCNINSRFFNIM